MKKNLLSISILLFQIYSFSQAPGIQWQKSYGGSRYEYAHDNMQTADGGFIVVGSTSSNDFDVTGYHFNPNGFPDGWVIKLNASGGLVWQKALGGSGFDSITSVAETNDGYIVAGLTNSIDGDITINRGYNDVWVVKLDLNGVIQWQKTYGGSSEDNASSIINTNDGGFILTGTTNSNDGDVTINRGSYDCWIIKLDAAGAIQWQKTFVNGYGEGGTKIYQTVDGGYIIGGNTSDTGIDYMVFKINSSGTIQWFKTFGSIGLDWLKDIQPTADGGYIVAGDTDSTTGFLVGNHGLTDAWIIKLNALGAIEWRKMYGGTGYDQVGSVQQTTDGGYIIGGSTNSNDGDVSSAHPGGMDYWVLKLSSSGIVEWQKTMGGISVEQGYTVRQTQDQGYIMSGFAYSTNDDVTENYGIQDIWVVKLAPAPLANTDFNGNMFRVYPNPVNSILQIDNPDHLKIEEVAVIDLSGKKLIFQQNIFSGKINVESLSKGIYLLEIRSNDKTYQQKFIKQ